MLWSTKITAINPLTGELTDFVGPLIEADSYEDAIAYCQENGMGYCRIMGEYMGSIDTDLNLGFFNKTNDDGFSN